ncbi:LemA family protein [Comamonas kerstersii]|uniref:LemA family protein n=1 Tax=Comamonas kerstersii TaxID=225992 RepID=UPI003A92BFBC
MGSTWMVVLAWLVVLALWGAAVYNRLRLLRNRVENAWSQIDVQLKRRHDLIPNLVEVARGYMQHEASTLEAVARARSQAVQASEALRGHTGQAQALGALAAAEQALGSSLGRLMVVAEAYPELKADAQMQSLSEEIASTENRIGFARQAYNDEVMAFNNKASQFPDLIWARLLGFAHMDMLQSTMNEQERQAPSVRF